MKAPTAVLLAVVLLISACASKSGVIAMDLGMVSITKQQGSGFLWLGNLKAEVFQEAAAHRALQNWDFEVINYSETKLLYILGNYPRVDMSFRSA